MDFEFMAHNTHQQNSPVKLAANRVVLSMRRYQLCKEVFKVVTVLDVMTGLIVYGLSKPDLSTAGVVSYHSSPIISEPGNRKLKDHGVHCMFTECFSDHE